MRLLKSLVKKAIGSTNWERIRTLYRHLRPSHGQPVQQLSGSAVPLEDIRDGLNRLGIRRGDLLLVHSSVSTLGKASPCTSQTPHNPVLYAAGVIDLLLELIGPQGTLLMPTEGNGAPEERASKKLVFDYSRTPSNRGLITELFRRRPEAYRSVHPWYNITGIGPLSEPLIKDHFRSTPYTMDLHSPWSKFTAARGKILFLGTSLDTNSLIHLPEYMYPEEYPRKIYYDAAIPLCYRDRDDSVQTMEVKIHIPDWRPGEVTRFCTYLDQRYRLYSSVTLGQTHAICCVASRQFEALCLEMRQNVCWYDVRRW